MVCPWSWHLVCACWHLMCLWRHLVCSPWCFVGLHQHEAFCYARHGVRCPSCTSSCTHASHGILQAAHTPHHGIHQAARSPAPILCSQPPCYAVSPHTMQSLLLRSPAPILCSLYFFADAIAEYNTEDLQHPTRRKQALSGSTLLWGAVVGPTSLLCHAYVTRMSATSTPQRPTPRGTAMV